MEFVHVAGEARVHQGEAPIVIAPREFGHPSICFRGVTYPFVKEGSQIFLRGLPDNITREERNDLAAHGFIYAGLVSANQVDAAVKDHAGTTDLKAVLEQEAKVRQEQEAAARADGGVKDGPDAFSMKADDSMSDGPAAPPRKSK